MGSGIAEAAAASIARRVAERLQERTDEEGTLCSGYLFANRQSAAWHESLRFLEIPDWLRCQHRFRCLEHNVKRMHCPDLFAAKRRANALREQVGRMEEEREKDRSANAPFRWVESDDEWIDAYLQNRLDQQDVDAASAFG